MHCISLKIQERPVSTPTLTTTADSPSPKTQVSAVEDVPPSCGESNGFAKDTRAAMHFMWGLGYFHWHIYIYKFQKKLKGVSLNPLHSHCQLANLVTIVTLRPEPGLLWPCERPPQGSWEHGASSKWWNLGHAPLLVKHMIICNISYQYQYSVYKVSEIS